MKFPMERVIFSFFKGYFMQLHLFLHENQRLHFFPYSLNDVVSEWGSCLRISILKTRKYFMSHAASMPLLVLPIRKWILLEAFSILPSKKKKEINVQIVAGLWGLNSTRLISLTFCALYTIVLLVRRKKFMDCFCPCIFWSISTCVTKSFFFHLREGKVLAVTQKRVHISVCSNKWLSWWNWLYNFLLGIPVFVQEVWKLTQPYDGCFLEKQSVVTIERVSWWACFQQIHRSFCYTFIYFITPSSHPASFIRRMILTFTFWLFIMDFYGSNPVDLSNSSLLIHDRIGAQQHWEKGETFKRHRRCISFCKFHHFVIIYLKVEINPLLNCVLF